MSTSRHKSRNILYPKKSLGQHFLVNKNTIEKIITACALSDTDTVLEIGPGLGVLTHEIAPRVKKLIAVETDRRLFAHLINNPPETATSIVNADILSYDFSKLPKDIKLIGNLPYNISSPILERILTHRHHFREAFITVQWEFGKRMVADMHTKDYSPLSIFAQCYTEPKILFKIKPTHFKPAPKVDSSFVHLVIRKKPLVAVNNEALFWKIVRTAFQQRRKTIVNALSPLIEKQQLHSLLESLSINQKLRAENLSISDFISIAHALDTNTI